MPKFGQILPDFGLEWEYLAIFFKKKLHVSKLDLLDQRGRAKNQNTRFLIFGLWPGLISVPSINEYEKVQIS